MPIAKKWKLTHVDSSKTFGSVEDFFNQSTSAKVDEEIVAKHIEIDDEDIPDEFLYFTFL